MTVIIHMLSKWYKFLNEDLADPRVQHLFMMGSFWPILSMIGFYLFFIYSLGPKFMEKRQPYKLDRIMQIYDGLQIIFNFYIFCKALDLGWARDYSFVCQPIDYSYKPRELEISMTVWKYFLVKLVDLMDTVFFVLRKKQDQVTFLHVYHHAGMVFASWFGTKYLAGGHSTFLGLINTFVHTIMYSYYLMSSLKVNTKRWKKYITQMQMLQFFLIVLHFTQLMWVEDCGYPLWPAAIMVPQNLFMLVLFAEFYYNTYIKKRQEKTSTKINANGIPSEISNGKKLKEQ